MHDANALPPDSNVVNREIDRIIDNTRIFVTKLDCYIFLEIADRLRICYGKIAEPKIFYDPQDFATVEIN